MYGGGSATIEQLDGKYVKLSLSPTLLLHNSIKVVAELSPLTLKNQNFVEKKKKQKKSLFSFSFFLQPHFKLFSSSLKETTFFLHKKRKREK